MLRRSIAFTWIGLAVFIAVVYVVLRVFVMKSFAELEGRQAIENVNRVVNAITERTANIDSKASDWAAWDDAYQFVQDGNSHFIRSNFALSAFTGIHLNLIAYTRNSGEIVYARWYEPSSDRMTPIPADVQRVIDRNGLLFRHRNPRSSTSGIVMLGRGSMLVASRPVVTSDEEGPIRGSLIFGQLLGRQEMLNLSRITRVPVVAERLDDDTLPADFAQARTELSGRERVIVKPINERVLGGYTLLDDIYRKPVLMLRVETPRTLYHRGLALSNYTLAALVILSILFGSILNVLLVRAVQKEHEYEEDTREFYSRIVTAATDGKLIMSDRSSIEKLCVAPIAQWDIRLSTDLPDVRNKVVEIASSQGMGEDRAWEFATCVGEAVTNAIKHAGGGKACVQRAQEGLLFVMMDEGPGIPALTLPDVALRKGYSTTGTLGMGYKIMVSLADRVHLATGPEGTTVAIEMKPQREEPAVGWGWIGSLK